MVSPIVQIGKHIYYLLIYSRHLSSPTGSVDLAHFLGEKKLTLFLCGFGFQNTAHLHVLNATVDATFL